MFLLFFVLLFMLAIFITSIRLWTHVVDDFVECTGYDRKIFCYLMKFHKITTLKYALHVKVSTLSSNLASVLKVDYLLLAGPIQHDHKFLLRTHVFRLNRRRAALSAFFKLKSLGKRWVRLPSSGNWLLLIKTRSVFTQIDSKRYFKCFSNSQWLSFAIFST